VIPAVRFGNIVGHVGSVAIRSVDAELVRLLNSPDFVVGGHGYVYPSYIPKSEVWLDRDMSPQATACSLLHELVERRLQQRLKYGYDRAHDVANGVEQQLRAHLTRVGEPRHPIRTASEWYRRWLSTHRDKLAA
jgi:hypothetical protein